MSIEILPIGSKIPVEIGPVTFVVSPMTAKQQAEVLDSIRNQAGDTSIDKFQKMRRALKYSLKDIKGVTMFGKPYKIEFDENGDVTDDCLEEISQLGQHNVLMTVVTKWLVGGYMDPKIPGVKVEFPKSRQKN